MARQFNPVEQAILRRVQGNLPDDAEPFRIIAEEAGRETGETVTEEQVLTLLRSLKEEGAIRRFGASLKHQKAGYSANSMVAWLVPEDRVMEVGEAMAERPEISHCYVRRTYPEWKYNLYTMIHGRTADEVENVIKTMIERTGVTDYNVLESIQELKKTSMTYFQGTDNES